MGDRGAGGKGEGIRMFIFEAAFQRRDKKTEGTVSRTGRDSMKSRRGLRREGRRKKIQPSNLLSHTKKKLLSVQVQGFAEARQEEGQESPPKGRRWLPGVAR